MTEPLTVYRICKTKYSADAFDGEGAFRFGGRWNSRGTRIIYTAGSLALAALEMIVHLDDDALLLEYSFVAAEVLSELVLPASDFRTLPADWSNSPAPVANQMLGDDWAKMKASAVLEVSSSIIPLEKNYLINPAHPDYSRIILGGVKKFIFDERLRKAS